MLSTCRADRSMYHALGYGTIMYLQATLTFEMVGCMTISKTTAQLFHIVHMSHISSIRIRLTIPQNK